MLIDLANGGNTVYVEIYGGAAVRTSASNTAVNTIINNGGQVILQP
jgi:hypothetical protein